jgi:predicted metal-dependent hydrolase
VQLNLAFDVAQDSSSIGQDANETRPQVLFVRHRRARRFIMRVLGDGTVRVTLPRWAARRDAQAFVDANTAWIAEQRARRSKRHPRSQTSVLRPLVEGWQRRKAARELPAMLLTLARLHGIDVPRVSIRDQRSRWGACSSRGTITLNWRLILVPEFVREYVLLHELMHRRELNHSRRFWRLVAACCPRHLEARQWLKKEGKLLWPDHA